MPGTTTLFTFPYPLGTDPISDGDDQIKALAEKLDALKANKTASAPSGGAVLQDADGCVVYRLPGQGILRLFLNNVGALVANTVITTLPAGCRPVVRCFGMGAVLTPSPAALAFDVDTTGTVKTSYAIGANSIWGGTIVFPLA